jgi:hypothetical protein
MADSARLFAILDQLIDGWCERRALQPLRVVLAGYPLVTGLTDEWATLYATIRELKGLAPGVLRPEESAAVAEAHALIYQLLKGSPDSVGILEAAG